MVKFLISVIDGGNICCMLLCYGGQGDTQMNHENQLAHHEATLRGGMMI